jgi:hypothetical protein
MRLVLVEYEASVLRITSSCSYQVHCVLYLETRCTSYCRYLFTNLWCKVSNWSNCLSFKAPYSTFSRCSYADFLTFNTCDLRRLGWRREARRVEVRPMNFPPKQDSISFTLPSSCTRSRGSTKTLQLKVFIIRNCNNEVNPKRKVYTVRSCLKVFIFQMLVVMMWHVIIIF